MPDFLEQYGKAAITSVGFFWKAGWAFVLGYTVSAMIQAFVPKARLTRYMGKPGLRSVSLATGFGAISSSCSFAALSTARSLVAKGAHFVAAVAFMFASTNLVIELGILIVIFLGWPFLAAELIGGLILIAISSLLIRLTYPQSWMDAGRQKVEEEADTQQDDFDWQKRIKSLQGWAMVGRRFVMEWAMVWREITIGFTVAGFMAVFVPESVWKAIFLADWAKDDPGNFLVALQNAAVAPFVAAATFIGSMGNIPLATVLDSGGVLFAGLMGFIYSDLMVPPLVKVNARYYGWRIALYIAGVMYVSIIITALLLHYGFFFSGFTPEGGREIDQLTRFKFDYTFFLNIVAVLLVGALFWLGRQGTHHHHHSHQHGKDHKRIGVQTIVALTAACLVLVGVAVWAWGQLGG